MDEQKTYEWLQIYESGKINAEELSREVQISRRQIYRIIKRYREEGVIGLYHKNRHKPSNHRISEARSGPI